MASKGKRKADNDTAHEFKPPKRTVTQSKDESKDSAKDPESDPGFLKGVTAFILSAGISKVRCELFKKQLQNNGGKCINEYNETDITHIIVDEKMEIDRMCRILKLELPPDPDSCHVVRSLWLSACLKDKKKVDEASFALDITSYIEKKMPKFTDIKPTGKDTTVKCTATDALPGTSGAEGHSTTAEENGSKLPMVGVMWRGTAPKKPEMDEDPDSDYSGSGNEGKEVDFEETPAVNAKGREIPKGYWVCAHSSNNKQINHNPHITDKLQELAKVYENTNDRWRALGYTKGIMAVKKYHKPITTFEEAKALPGVGNKLAEKIWEIVESGELRKLNELTSQDDIKTLNLFTGVWGAGAHTARAWIQQGHRSLDDIRSKANLTRQQKIGLRYYDDLLDRMPREEATEIEAMVITAAHSINPGLVCMACGSYRRGKSTCGDVDVLVTHPDGKSHKGVFSVLLNKLRESGFLTDDLVTQEDSGNQKKYLGVCRLPGENRRHRRLDVIVVPYDEFACALMYFTGSAHFNRSMRHMAGKMGMSLSEHSLNKGVVRQRGQKINDGYPLPTPTEEAVFQHLGLAYRPPTERDH